MDKAIKVLLAAFYTPGIRAIEYLIQLGLRPQQIHLLTHDLDRNNTLMEYAIAHGIATKSFSVKSSDAFEWISEFQPDVLFSLYFRDIIPSSVLDIPSLGAVNLHPSLLPKYRGTFSSVWAIINDEKYTGFTYHYMLPQVDAGNIIIQRRVRIRPNDTAYSLYHRLIKMGMSAFGDVVNLVVKDKYVGKKQVGKFSYYPRKVPYGGYITPKWNRQQIDRFIRAMYFPTFGGAKVKLVNSEDREIFSVDEFDALAAEGQIDLDFDNA